MVSYYTIAGKQVASHWLSMGILGSLIGGGMFAFSGPKKSTATAAPPINASSSGEADFIQKFLDEQEKSTKH